MPSPVPVGGRLWREGCKRGGGFPSRRLWPGDFVVGSTGWQSRAVAKGDALLKVEASRAPLSTALGVLGMPGMTAYTGLLNIGQPKAGETVERGGGLRSSRGDRRTDC